MCCASINYIYTLNCLIQYMHIVTVSMIYLLGPAMPPPPDICIRIHPSTFILSDDSC